MSKEQTDWVMVPRADAEDARDLLRLYGNNADWAALAARFDKHCAVPAEAQVVATQHRVYYDDSQTWSEWREGKWPGLYVNKFEERPLYLHPASPSPAGGVQGVGDLDLRTLVPGFRFDWSGLRNRLDEAFAKFEKLDTYEMRAAHLDELARQFEDAVTAALSSQAQTTGGVE